MAPNWSGWARWRAAERACRRRTMKAPKAPKISAPPTPTPTPMPIRAPVDRLEDDGPTLPAPGAAELEASKVSDDVPVVVARSVFSKVLELEVEDEAGVVDPEERLVTMVPVGTLTALAAQSQSLLYPKQQKGEVPSWTPPGHDFMPLPVVTGTGGR